MLQEILLNRSADKASFAIYGVQPGISKGQIDATSLILWPSVLTT
ncbi:hypothetical protein ACUDCK_21640 [Achromobacter sp. CF-sbj1-Ac2-l]|nr:hypothetical protein L532_1535 [Bordetella bronchiseptica OSU095]